LFGRTAGPFLVSAKTASATAHSRRQGRPPGRRGTRLALDGGEHGRTLVHAGTWAGTPRAWRATVSLSVALVLAATAPVARAVAAPMTDEAAEIDRAVTEASVRFGLSTRLIRAVLAAESGGRVDAVSPRGAMGLMQVMPAAWREMRVELGLGGDPFRPRDNILAGAGYLRALRDRFGSPGDLAAYNAGPGRYQRHLDGAAGLPRETIAYVARVRRQLDPEPLATRRPAADWRLSGLFVASISQDTDPGSGSPLFIPPAGEGGR
jgi:soluble lytic murein transglycosylase-like protein